MNPVSCILGPMTVLDYFVLLVVVASVASGATKGIIRVVVSVAFTVAGLVLAAYSYTYAAGVLRLFVAAWLANLLGFATVFVLVFAGGSILSWKLRGILKRAHVGWIDHVLGAVFGFIRGWLICAVVYLALTAFPVRPAAVEEAKFGPALLEGAQVIAYLTSAELRQQFFDGYEKVKRLWEQKR